MSTMIYKFKILNFDNYDGDSFDLTLDLGFDLVAYHKCRIEGIDTPELRGGTDDSKAAGRLARDVARDFVNEALSNGGALFQSETYRGKFGRPLGDIIRKRDGQSMREYLIGEHLGVRYHGQAKSDVADAHERNLQYLKHTGKIQQL